MEPNYRERLIKSNNIISGLINEHVASKGIISDFVISNYYSLFFKNDQHFFKTACKIEFDILPLKTLLTIDKNIQSELFKRKLHTSLNITSRTLDISESNDFLLSILNSKCQNISSSLISSHNHKIFCHLIISSLDSNSKSLFENLHAYLLKSLKTNSHIQQNEFTIYIYLEKVYYHNTNEERENLLSYFESVLDFSIVKIIKFMEYEKNNETIQLLRVLKMNKKSKLIIMDKFGSVLYNDDYNIDMISQLLSIDNWNKKLSGGNDFKQLAIVKNDGLQMIDKEFNRLIDEMDKLFRILKSKPTFEKINNNLHIKLKEIIFYNNNLESKKEYYLSKIVDKSILFFHSYFHRVFYPKLYSSITSANSEAIKPVFKRFKNKNRNKIEDAKKIYRELLENYNVENKSLTVKKKWYYEIGRIENTYKIYNTTGMILHEEELEKLEDYSKMRNKIRKKIKKLPGEGSKIQSNYKIYKKKHKKNLLLEITTPEGSEFWENQLGKRYLIYINFQDIDAEAISVLGDLTQLQIKYEFKKVPDFEIKAFLYVTEETEYNEDCKIFKNKLNIHIINEYQVINLYHCVNPFDNEISHVFLYIDEEGYLNPFSISDINLIEEKLNSFLSPKIEITKDQYAMAKKECNLFFIEDYLSFSKYDYRLTFGVVLEKNKIYNDDNVLVGEKFYCKGKMKIRDSDLDKDIAKSEELNGKFSKKEEKEQTSSLKSGVSSEKVSLNKFGTKLTEEILQLPQLDYLFDVEIYKTINLSVFKKQCDNCEATFAGLFQIYLCYFDSLVYCHKCVESKNTLLKCTDEHNLITIIDYEKTKNSGNLSNLEIYKFGSNSFNCFKQIPKYDQGFCCSYCDKTKSDSIRYICLNCRGCNMILYCEGDTNANGFVDVCEDCFTLLIDYHKGRLDDSLKPKVEYYLEIAEDRDRHFFDSHIYIKLNYPSGSYYLY